MLFSSSCSYITRKIVSIFNWTEWSSGEEDRDNPTANFQKKTKTQEKDESESEWRREPEPEPDLEPEWEGCERGGLFPKTFPHRHQMLSFGLEKIVTDVGVPLHARPTACPPAPDYYC